MQDKTSGKFGSHDVPGIMRRKSLRGLGFHFRFQISDFRLKICNLKSEICRGWEHSRPQENRTDAGVCPYAIVSALKTCDSWSR
jgi:hypothetical protein